MTSLSAETAVNTKRKYRAGGWSLKEGPVIYQSEDHLVAEERERKDLTLAELNHAFKMYLVERNLPKSEVTILSQFSVIFNDPVFSTWHTLIKSQQSDALSAQVLMPPVYDELITMVGTTAGDAQIIKSVVKDALQNSIDSFSHAAYLQKKYISRFPGIKVILYADQINKLLVLAVVDNGHGRKITKPRKSHTGQEYGDDFASRFVDWVIRKFVEKDEGEIHNEIAYTGGQGMALKKIGVELRLDAEVHYLASSAVFDLRLKNYF
ncbi:MAG: hypothetical protein EP297_02160 [Gammaproteobacteria bacterium]|nr:MAG: hypothetical protein EP297_02160 [Gammaproteobacteria bacterium]